MPNHEQNVFLVVYVFHLLEANYFGDRQHFQRQEFLPLSMPDKYHAPECAGAYGQEARIDYQKMTSTIARQ